MQKLLTILTLAMGISLSAQKSNYTEFSYTEFFQLIEVEKDTIFRLDDALIRYNEKTDARYKAKFGDTLYNKSERIIVNKHVELNNVQFLSRLYNGTDGSYSEGTLRDIHFKKDVVLKEVISIIIFNCLFSGNYDHDLLECENEDVRLSRSSRFFIMYSTFTDFGLFKNCFQSVSNQGNVIISNNTFTSKKRNTTFNLTLRNSFSGQFRENSIRSNGVVSLNFGKIGSSYDFLNNSIFSGHIILSLNDISAGINLKDNQFSSKIICNIDALKSQDEVEWSQFKDRLVSSSSFFDYAQNSTANLLWRLDSTRRQQLTKSYLDSVRYYDNSSFANEIGLKGLFYNHYRNKYNTETANEVYFELKDFETKRLKILYQQNPSFRTYFKWKVNQFLRLFSNYGTEPSKAIVFSLYVIIFFAIIYLFFPNSWDSHGKKRIMNRFRFFTKYMKRDAGIHEVYLEEKKEDLLEYEDFKNYMEASGKSIPRFFLATAVPLYKWAISGTKLSSAFLKRVDIMQGKWKDVPENKRWWKGMLLIGAFTIAILYDLIIKMLNALMLSINTFTTLGFGEIPIKGLPRYLAIIQGFIGWFMLTIFSVSLISQLLN
jgi:hypothetical protein